MIGVYDSGVGGLSVWKELVSLMPGESFVYFSDGANCPYGPKDPSFVVERACRISQWLIDRGCELVTVACNTATAAAITSLRSSFDIPFIGMEPAIKPAALLSKSGVVGVLATAGTFKGRLYLDTLARFAGDVKVIERVGSGLVELVERGELDSPAAEALVRSYVEPMVEQGADHIVLGCTHYPFLAPLIERIADGRATVVNPAPAVARQAQRVLETLRPVNTGIGETRFFSTGSTDVMQLLVGTICPYFTPDYFSGSLNI